MKFRKDKYGKLTAGLYEVWQFSDGTWCAEHGEDGCCAATREECVAWCEHHADPRVGPGKTAKYRLITAPGRGLGNTAYVDAYYDSLTAARHAEAASVGALVLQAGEFSTDQTEDWADWAHAGGYAAGALTRP